VEPMRTKSSTETAIAFEKILKDLEPQTPNYVLTDQGGEFGGGPFKRLLQRYGIGHYHALASPHKSVFAERKIRDLKSRVFKYLTAKNTRKFIDQLPKIVRSMNNTVCRAHGMKPSQINIDNEDEVFRKMYRKYFEEIDAFRKKMKLKEKRKDDKSVLKEGTRVRISVEKAKFEPGYTQRWKKEVFRIHRVKRSYPTTFYLVDKNNEILKGAFYRQELQPV
jgi:hypothetical protein